MKIDHPRAVSRARPLAGRRIVLTRPTDQADDFEARVRALGGHPEIAPAIAIRPPDELRPLDAALGRIGSFDWIVFTSANAVRAVGDRLRVRGIGVDRIAAVRLAAVGPATAAALETVLRAPDVIARSASAKTLSAELPVAPGLRVLVPRGELAGDALSSLLRLRGVEPHDVIAYRTVPGEGIPRIIRGLRDGNIDALLFASGSAARFVADARGHMSRTRVPRPTGTRPAVFCIGNDTARVATEAGFPPDAVASVATQRAMVDVMAQWFVDHIPNGYPT